MRLGWVFFFEIALVNIFIAAIIVGLLADNSRWRSPFDVPISAGRRSVYLPAIFSGMAITLRHLKNMLLGRTKVTMQYPEQKWDSHMPDHYRGAPALVKDERGSRPLRRLSALRIHLPAARDQDRSRAKFRLDDKFAKVEKYPDEFDIDMIRCIYCGMCEEVCPEQAIFLRKDYAITGFTRADMVHDKEKLLEIGGVMHGSS